MERVRDLGEGSAAVRGILELTPRSKKLLESSIIQSKRFNHAYVGTEHFWLALLREEESVAVSILHDLDVDTEALSQSIDAASAVGQGQSRPDARQGQGKRERGIGACEIQP